MDYVVDQLGLQIRCPTVYPLAPRILTALLSIIGPSFAGHVTDILGEVMENLQAYRGHDGYVYELLGVISAAAPSLVPPRTKLALKGEMMPAKSGTPPLEMLDADAVQMPAEQRTAEKMIGVVVHFILSDRRKIRLRSLQALSDLALAFRSNRDALLPLVHLTWPAVLGRVSEADPFVVGQALKTIADVAEIAGDFMRARVNQELWPALQGRPLQSATLDCFSRIALLVGLSLKTVQGLCCAMIEALRPDSSQSLKESAIRLGEALAKSFPDALWFVLFCQVDQTQDFIEGVDTRPYRTVQSGQISRPHLLHLQQILLHQPVP
jgi:hypothetical protein